MGDDNNNSSPAPIQRELAQKKPPLSCTSCRARKLKCDKRDPCGNCVRSGSSGDCVFPARKRIQRPRKTKNAELLQRLNRLESIVGKVGLTNLEEWAGTGGEEGPPPAADSSKKKPHGGEDPPAKRCSMKMPQPPQENSTASRYLSSEFWSSLCDEVVGLKQVLEQSTDSDDEDAAEATTPESVGGGRTSIPSSPGMLLGSPQSSVLQPIAHPSPSHIRYLASAYFRNVDMHLKILHRPTILNALFNLAENPETASELDFEQEALFFAIYYAAVTTLTPMECILNLGRSWAELSALYQAGLEQALVRADYLNNSSLKTLQALTLYTCCLRSHNGSRASWALLGLPIRLAQALNIHQDGDGKHVDSRFGPYEAELRRRLWWQLIVLDIRAAEDRGTNTIIARGSYDTRLPHNIDDTEFGPESKEPLRDRPGPSDATFSLCTAQSSGIFLWIEHAQGAGPEHSEEDTVRQAQYLESQFVKGADPGHVGSYLASVAVRLIILKMWLVMRYPLHPRGGRGVLIPSIKNVTLPPLPPPDPDTTLPAAVSRESTLRTATSIMELSHFAQTGPYSDRFRWWSNTYVQWHPLAVALAELCTQTEGEAVERAWQVVEDVFPRWRDKIADARRGSLWRPIRKLYKKAKVVRIAALSKGSSDRGVKPQPQAQPTSTPAPGSQLGGAKPGVDDMAIDPALTSPDSGFFPPGTSVEDAVIRDPIIPRPRHIEDMVISDISAYTLTSSAPSTQRITNANSAIVPNAITNANQTHTRVSGTDMTTEPTPPNFDAFTIDSGQSIAQSWLAWPDINFDMASMYSTGKQNTLPPQAPASAMAGTVAGGEGFHPALLDNSMMDWSTWDEFVLDTYADSTPKSGSGASEKS